MDSPEPTAWKDSLSTLQSLIATGDTSKGGHVKIEKCCALILDGGASTNNNGEEDIPAEVRSTISTIYLRALIHLGRYTEVVDYLQKQQQSGGVNVQEEAYALYRLRRYEACRSLCASSLELNEGSATNNNINRGLMHVYAQTLYRLGETQSADEVYFQLLSSELTDADEREDALANALANRTANYTSGSLLKFGGNTATELWLEKDEAIVEMLSSYGQSDPSNNGDGDKDLLQNYDLAYNLATYLLVSSDARSHSYVRQAKQLLGHAEKSALTILESSQEENVEGETNEEERKAKQNKQQQLAEQEAAPIRANLALANLLLGGEENETAALRAYLTCITKAVKPKNSTGMHANLLAMASNNLALLRDGKESVFDVLKRIPATSALSVSEDVVAKGSKGGNNSGGGGGGAAVVPLVGATPQQVRTALFNRALLLAKMGNVSGCSEALAVLRASLEVAYHGDEVSAAGSNGGGGGAEGSPKSKGKGKKKKNTTADSGGDVRVVVKKDIPTAKPSSEGEAVAWNARANLIESELRRITDAGDGSKPEVIISQAISDIDTAAKRADDDASSVLDYVKSQLFLHGAVVSNKQSKPQPFIDVLGSLPSSVQSCPGTVVTLASLYGALDKDDTSRPVELLSSLGEDVAARLALTEFHMERGQYEDVIEVLESIVEKDADSTTQVEMMTATALLVKALSYTDSERAGDYAERLEIGEDIATLDGEELESMEIPRFAKKASENGGGGGGISSKVRKIIASTGGKRGSNLG